MVDDSEIGDPGDCKVETWGSRSDTSDHLGVISPACVFSAVPWAELGINAQRSRSGGGYETQVGPKAKAALVPIEEFGVGIGVVASVGYSNTLDRASSAVAFIPFTVAPIEAVRVNLNLGWTWDGEAHRHFATAGLGGEWQVHSRLALVGEVYGRHAGRWAKQIGLRPTLIERVLDLDLVYGRNIDGNRSNWFTFGAILKF